MNFNETIADSGGLSLFLRLKDKESVIGIFQGKPYEFFHIFEDGKSRIVEAGTKGSRFRFKLNILVKSGPVFIPWIFENGKTVYKQLMEINKEYPLEETFLKITRNGSDMETTYSILPLIKQAISPETAALIAATKLHDLNPEEKNEVEPDLPF